VIAASIGTIDVGTPKPAAAPRRAGTHAVLIYPARGCRRGMWMLKVQPPPAGELTVMVP